MLYSAVYNGLQSLAMYGRGYRLLREYSELQQEIPPKQVIKNTKTISW